MGCLKDPVEEIVVLPVVIRVDEAEHEASVKKTRE